MKSLSIILICMSSVVCYAKNGFYLQPTGGIGPANVNIRPGTKIYGSGTNVNLYESKSITGYHFGVIAGYEKGNLRFVSGVGYMQSGRNLTYTYDYHLGLTYASGTQSDYWREREAYTHVIVPISVGYRTKRDRKIILVPYAGMAWSYNMSMKYDATGFVPKASSTLKGSEFNKSFSRSSLWLTSKVDIEIKCSKNSCLTIGPSVYYMVNNVYEKRPAADLLPNSPFQGIREQRNFDILMNVGMKFSIHRSPGKVIKARNKAKQ